MVSPLVGGSKLGLMEKRDIQNGGHGKNRPQREVKPPSRFLGGRAFAHSVEPCDGGMRRKKSGTVARQGGAG